MAGLVESIYVAPTAGVAMVSVVEAVAVAGRGLAGDRYETGAGTFSSWPKDHEFTLIEGEAIEAMNRLPGVRLGLGDTRRNVTTRGIALNELVGREFTVGSVRCLGTRLCPPCDHLRKLLGIAELIQIMEGRGGLRATLVEGGTIRVGDSIAIAAEVPRDVRQAR
ncbi:MAG: sulfurase [Phycisphaerales bacterium]|nr:sulfurase [Phycisphaerales bacterium]